MNNLILIMITYKFIEKLKYSSKKQEKNNAFNKKLKLLTTQGHNYRGEGGTGGHAPPPPQ